MSQATRLVKSLVPVGARRALRSALFKLRERSFEPYVKEMTIDGHDYRFFIGDSEGQRWYEGDWIGKELAFLREHVIRPGDVLFDCGAHHGCMTALFARWIGDEGRVLAFDPVPKNVDIARRNMALNGLANVTVEHKAVGAAPDTVVITEESNAQIIGRKGRGVEVEVTPLDAYADLRPTVLKIDVEGFEAEALKGAREILKTRPRIAMEIHLPQLFRYDATVDDLFDLIGPGYRYWVQWDDDAEPLPYDRSTPITERVHLFAIPSE